MSGKKFLASVSVNATDDYQAIENASLTVSFGAVLAALDVLELTHTLRDIAGPHLDSDGRALRASMRIRK